MSSDAIKPRNARLTGSYSASAIVSFPEVRFLGAADHYRILRAVAAQHTVHLHVDTHVSGQVATPARTYVGPEAVGDFTAPPQAVKPIEVVEDTDPAVISSTSCRLVELKEMAAEEGIDWNKAAEQQLWQLLKSIPSPSRPAIGVDQNGDIRALWENMLQEQVGVRCKGHGPVEAILFQRTEHGFRREIATIDIPELLPLIREMKLIHVTRG